MGPTGNGNETGRKRLDQSAATVRSCAIGAFVFASIPALANCPPQYEIAAVYSPPDCGVIGDGVVWGWGMNEQGWLTGDNGCIISPGQAFVSLTSGEWEPIELPPGTFQSVGNDISDSGVIVGNLVLPSSGFGSLAYRWDGVSVDVFEPLPGHNWTQANAISSSTGQIVGFSQHNVTGQPPREAMLWDGDCSMSLDDVLGSYQSNATDISENGVFIVGWRTFEPGGERFGFRLDSKGALIDLGLVPDSHSNEPRAVNNEGDVVGYCGGFPDLDDPGQTDRHAYLWSDGVISDLGVIGDWERSIALDINDESWVVGYLSDSAPDTGFLYTNGVMHVLHELVEGTQTFGSARAINELDGILAVEGGTTYLLQIRSDSITDLNCDGETSFADLLILLSAWGPCTECIADLDESGFVDFQDLLQLLSNWS